MLVGWQRCVRLLERVVLWFQRRLYRSDRARVLWWERVGELDGRKAPAATFHTHAPVVGVTMPRMYRRKAQRRDTVGFGCRVRRPMQPAATAFCIAQGSMGEVSPCLEIAAPIKHAA